MQYKTQMVAHYGAKSSTSGDLAATLRGARGSIESAIAALDDVLESFASGGDADAGKSHAVAVKGSTPNRSASTITRLRLAELDGKN